jgi:uncharacterized protein (DUF1778 family)
MAKKVEKKTIPMQIFIPEELHVKLKEAAALDHRTMAHFVLYAIGERADRFLEEDIDSKDFTPPGLR